MEEVKCTGQDGTVRAHHGWDAGRCCMQAAKQLSRACKAAQRTSCNSGPKPHVVSSKHIASNASCKVSSIGVIDSGWVIWVMVQLPVYGTIASVSSYSACCDLLNPPLHEHHVLICQRAQRARQFHGVWCNVVCVARLCRGG